MNKLFAIKALLTAFVLSTYLSGFAQAPNISYQTPQTYTVGTSVTPLLPQNSGGSVPTDGYGTVTTYAGTRASGSANGPIGQASFKSPYALTFDNSGNLYVVDRSNKSIRKITPAGIVSTLAGNASLPFGDGTGTSAGFKDPISIAVDNAGNAFVAETNGTIRKITSAGVVTTLAGQADAHSFANGTGSVARFYYPTALGINNNGDLLLADERNYRIRKISPTGDVSTYAGAGIYGFNDGPAANSQFEYMTNAALDKAGNFYVTDDPATFKIRKITPGGLVSTFAGPGATGPLAAFITNGQLAFDLHNNLYVSEPFKNIIYKVTPTGEITIIAGKLNISGSADGYGNSARFNLPQGMAVDGSGNLYVADSNNERIRKVSLNGYSIDKDLPAGLIFDATTGKISGTPATVSPATDYVISAFNVGGSSSTTIKVEVKTATNALTAPNIRYESPKIYTVGETVSLPADNFGGAVPAGAFTITPSLPPGLTFNADNGLISGIPTAASAAIIYTVSATNSINTSTATVNIKVLATPPATIAAPAISYQTPKVYAPNVAIVPLAPSNNGGEVKKYSPGLVKNFAGTGLADRNDGPKNAATFNSPGQLIFDGSGNIFLTDINNYNIRKITAAGIVSTYAGGYGQGSLNGPAASAQFRSPQGIAMDKQGNVFVADLSAIRKITPAGIVSNLAGGIVSGYNDGTGSAAQFDGAVSLAIDQNDNIYVADQNNLLIRKVTPAGLVTTVAGNRLRGHLDGIGVNATFDGPAGIAIDAAGNLYVADYLTIRKINPAGLVTTIAGNGNRKVVNGPAASASFGNAKSLAIAPTGDLYIVDIGNDIPNESSDVLRLLDVNGIVSTVDLRTNGSTRTFLSQPASVTFNNNELYITGNNNYIQNISFDKYTIDKALPPGLNFDAYTGIISGTPTALFAATNYLVTAYNTGGSNNTIVSIKIGIDATTTGAPNISYSSPQKYIVNSTIAPLLATNTGGPVPTDEFGQVRTLAGSGLPGIHDDVGTAAQFAAPSGSTIGVDGNLYVADINVNAVRKITPDAIVTTFAGNGIAGNVNATGAAARFNRPLNIAADKTGNFYVLDYANNQVKKITTDGTVSAFAGSGANGSADGIGLNATFKEMTGIDVDSRGNIIIADGGNNLIRKITPAGIVTTIAGAVSIYDPADGPIATASITNPICITIDKDDNIYFGENYRVRKITTDGKIVTIAGSNSPGSADGVAAAATFNGVNEIYFDLVGNLYIADFYNQKIRKVDQDGSVTTFAGTGVRGKTNGDRAIATFNEIGDVTLSNTGNLYVSDTRNNLIRSVNLHGYTINRSLPAGLSFNSFTGAITGTPTAASAAADYKVVAYNKDGNSVTMLNIEVKNISQLSFPPITGKTVCDADFNATVTSTNTVTPIIYTSSNSAVATVSATGVIHMVAPGISDITASQTGDALYNDAAPITRQLAVTASTTTKLNITNLNTGFNCSGNTITFTASATNSQNPSYQWLVNGVNAGTDNATFQTSTLNDGDKVSCILTNHPTGAGCFTTLTAASNDITVNITVLPAVMPSVTISANVIKIYQGTAVTFSATPSNAGNDIVYQWQVNGINAGTNSNTFITADLNDGDEVTCTITTDLPCSVPATSNALTITVMPPAQIVPPNTFTPNNDGINDTWNIPVLAYFPNSRVSVFNRNGSLLMQSIGYNRPWDGTYNGKQLPAGVYYYIIDAGDGRAKVAGSVTIIR